jgi:hypothetical protein
MISKNITVLFLLRNNFGVHSSIALHHRSPFQKCFILNPVHAGVIFLLVFSAHNYFLFLRETFFGRCEKIPYTPALGTLYDVVFRVRKELGNSKTKTEEYSILVFFSTDLLLRVLTVHGATTRVLLCITRKMNFSTKW